MSARIVYEPQRQAPSATVVRASAGEPIQTGPAYIAGLQSVGACPRCGNRRYVLESCRAFVVLRCELNAHDERLEFQPPTPPYRAPGTRPYCVAPGCTTRPLTGPACARHRGAA